MKSNRPPNPQALLASIVDSSDDAIISKGPEGIISSWNPGAERIFGFSETEAVGKSITLIVPDDRLAEESEITERITAGERVQHFETQRKRRDGTILDISMTISPIQDEQAMVIGASIVARDISEQKVTRGASFILSAIVDSSEDAIVSKNLRGIITSWNAAAQRIFGYTATEAIGQSVLMLIPADRKDEEADIIGRLMKGERVEHFQTIRVRKDGQHFPVSLTISPVRDTSGRIVGASKIARDITDLKRIADEREELLVSERTARAQAEHASRMKDEFLSTVSHELRTPLNAIVGWTQVLRETANLDPDAASGLETIERNARVQAQLIDDLLDMGRIVSGKFVLDVERFDLASVIRDALAVVHHAAIAKEIRIKTVLDSRSGWVTGDRKRLQQVIWNLLTNAIKFSTKGGSIAVILKRINSHLEISVSDNGEGITPEFLPHVFERFRQADATTTRRHGGLGIGLAIVKQLVEMHGGHVHAMSEGPGKGATFMFTVPVLVAQPLQEIVPQPSKRSGAPFSDDLLGVRVLALDDDRDSLEVVKRVLESRRAQVATCSTVAEALKLFSSFGPDIVISDIGLPDHDGYEFISRLRSLPGGRSVPAAALTALARAEDRMRALRAGFQTHMPKPVAPAELIAMVHSLVSLSEDEAP